MVHCCSAPAIFVLLFVFFNIINNSGTAAVWAPYLMDVFALTFAILIILYLSTCLTGKLWAFCGAPNNYGHHSGHRNTAMVTAATTFTGLGLPVLVYLPNVPIQFTFRPQLAILFRGLGLGDFFFAGVLIVQTFKNSAKKLLLSLQ